MHHDYRHVAAALAVSTVKLPIGLHFKPTPSPVDFGRVNNTPSSDAPHEANAELLDVTQAVDVINVFAIFIPAASCDHTVELKLN